MILKHRDAIAIKMAGVEGWEPFAYEAVKGGVLVTGGVVATKTRGKNKGEKKWLKPHLTLVVSDEAYAAYYREYEETTGNCGDCFGEGLVFAGWHHVNSVKHAPCHRCNATGKAPKDTPCAS